MTQLVSGQYAGSHRALFAKITAQLGLNSRLEISHDYLYALNRLPYTCCSFNAGLSSNAEDDPVHDNTTQLAWTTAFGTRWANELIVARNAKQHRCIPKADFPTIQVDADEGTIVGGIQEVCRDQDNAQSILALTDNLGRTAGSHHLTFGTHNERIRLYNDDLGLLHSAGRWHFPSLDALEQGEPDGYVRDLPGPFLPPSGRPDFTAVEVAAYVQDQWAPNKRLTLTGDVRVDVPFLPPRPRNPDVLETLASTRPGRRAGTCSGVRGWASTTTCPAAAHRSSGAGSDCSKGGPPTPGSRKPTAATACSTSFSSASTRPCRLSRSRTRSRPSARTEPPTP